MKITTLTEYTPEIAARVRELLIQLSRSGKDRGEIPQEWFDELIASDAHDMLLAIDDSGKIQGIATLSIIMGPIVRRVAYDDNRRIRKRSFDWYRDLIRSDGVILEEEQDV